MFHWFFFFLCKQLMLVDWLCWIFYHIGQNWSAVLIFLVSYKTFCSMCKPIPRQPIFTTVSIKLMCSSLQFHIAPNIQVGQVEDCTKYSIARSIASPRSGFADRFSGCEYSASIIKGRAARPGEAGLLIARGCGSSLWFNPTASKWLRMAESAAPKR